MDGLRSIWWGGGESTRLPRRDEHLSVAETLLAEVDFHVQELERVFQLRHREEQKLRTGVDYSWLVTTTSKGYKVPQLERLELEELCLKVLFDEDEMSNFSQNFEKKKEKTSGYLYVHTAKSRKAEEIVKLDLIIDSIFDPAYFMERVGTDPCSEYFTEQIGTIECSKVVSLFRDAVLREPRVEDLARIMRCCVIQVLEQRPKAPSMTSSLSNWMSQRASSLVSLKFKSTTRVGPAVHSIDENDIEMQAETRHNGRTNRALSMPSFSVTSKELPVSVGDGTSGAYPV